MKYAKSIFITALLTLTTFTAALYLSCNKKSNPCNGVTCKNGGTCVNGICSCPTGYAGTYCQNTVAQQAAGEYVGGDCNGTDSIALSCQAGTKYGVFILVPVGSGSCDVLDTLYGTINDTTITFLTDTFKTSCGSSYIYNDSGTIIGDNIILITNLTAKGVTTYCYFRGNKN